MEEPDAFSRIGSPRVLTASPGLIEVPIGPHEAADQRGVERRQHRVWN
jgi:hypothetical protein